jgi:hypothetical protein
MESLARERHEGSSARGVQGQNERTEWEIVVEEISRKETPP